MRPSDFPYEKFLKLKEEKEKKLLLFFEGKERFVPVVQRPTINRHYTSMCRYKDKSLEYQLDFLASYIELKSDFIYSYLEPWHGVGIYAAAFGCPYIWSEHDAPQTLPIYKNIKDIKNFKKPDIDNSEIMKMVIETIKYFREKTGDMLHIALTDTQSPNDNASLIMDACEFFASSITEMEQLHPFMQEITNVITRFTNMQIEALGNRYTRPGHTMISSPYLRGISISDDNMSIISPQAYKNSVLPYNNQLSNHFGGLSIHTCGNFIHNAELLLQTQKLIMVDCAIGSYVDPNPNDPGKLKEIFKGRDIILKVRLGAEEIDLLEDIVDTDLKLIVEIRTDGTIDEKNRKYDNTKEKIERIFCNNKI